MASERSILAVSVGNTRTAIAAFTGSSIGTVDRLENSDGAPALAARIAALIQGVSAGGEVPIVIATVNQAVCEAIEEELRRSSAGVEILRIGREISPAIGMCVDPETLTGQDRLLNAAAAFERFGQACVVVDAGTAVTVDFVDGQGTFHGGAIAPGARMQLNALHEQTTSLPDVEFAVPRDEAFGGSTTQAMLHGAYYGIRGLVRHLVERYAEAYRAYPKVVATGGDARVLFEDDEFIEHIVENLGLHGIRVSFDAEHGVHRSLDADQE